MKTKHVVSAAVVLGVLVASFAPQSPLSVASASAGERGCHDVCADRRDECMKHAHDDGERARCEHDHAECDRGCDDHR